MLLQHSCTIAYRNYANFIRCKQFHKKKGIKKMLKPFVLFLSTDAALHDDVIICRMFQAM